MGTLNVRALAKFIEAREAVRRNKEAGRPKPWTKDPILQCYRFCNVHREDDSVTKWVAEHWRTPYRDHPDLWFLMSAARWINWPATLQEVGESVFGIGTRTGPTFDPQKLRRMLENRAKRGDKVWTGAYVVCTQGNPMSKERFIPEHILFPLWQLRTELRPRPDDTLASFAARIRSVKHQGSFMVGQMIADAKYGRGPLARADDWTTFAISGPGSRRGMNRVFNRDVDASWKEQHWFDNLMVLRSALNLDDEFHNQDLQNCLCEFDKYERVRLGEGRPRNTYPGV